MQIILHYSCILPVLVDLNISEATLIQVITYASAGSVMNKVFPTSRVCAWWAFKVAVHRTCVLLLLHEWLEHASQSLSGGVGWLGGWGQGWRGQPRVTALSLSCTWGLQVCICHLLCLWVLLNPSLCFSSCHCPHGLWLHSHNAKTLLSKSLLSANESWKRYWKQFRNLVTAI